MNITDTVDSSKNLDKNIDNNDVEADIVLKQILLMQHPQVLYVKV